ncbi:MAG: hypothetical protein KKA19_02935, partial [Candidatus Margulisbacteria bacterium]|nr:hypothetical protein [Candidatus Margulisiibacteriota bacterium]
MFNKIISVNKKNKGNFNSKDIIPKEQIVSGRDIEEVIQKINENPLKYTKIDLSNNSNSLYKKELVDLDLVELFKKINLKNTKINTLVMGGHSLTDKCLEVIFPSLGDPENPLVNVKLEGNKVTLVDITEKAWAKLLVNNDQYILIDLSNNYFNLNMLKIVRRILNKKKNISVLGLDINIKKERIFEGTLKDIMHEINMLHKQPYERIIIKEKDIILDSVNTFTFVLATAECFKGNILEIRESSFTKEDVEKHFLRRLSDLLEKNNIRLTKIIGFKKLPKQINDRLEENKIRIINYEKNVKYNVKNLQKEVEKIKREENKNASDLSEEKYTEFIWDGIERQKDIS